MKKMIQVLLFSAVMFSPSFLNHAAVNAEERHSVPENSSMVSYGKLCNCGGVNYLLSTSYGEWVNASEEKCTSHTYGTDIIQTRSAAKTYRWKQKEFVTDTIIKERSEFTV